MLEKFLKNQDTKEITKAEQKNINEGDSPSDFNCYNATADKFYAC
ncbi:hypothetical protein GKZ90_0000255 [Flavobacterium sp. MC2016-06]|jgi:hypothetical protein|nr:hypothetical protein [Flavobacterium sp. MC2016-06]